MTYPHLRTLRPITVTAYRTITSTAGRKTLVKRYARTYARVSTAIRRTTELLALEGEPGDLYEVAHENGLQIGTIKVRVGGFDANFVWDQITRT